MLRNHCRRPCARREPPSEGSILSRSRTMKVTWLSPSIALIDASAGGLAGLPRLARHDDRLVEIEPELAAVEPRLEEGLQGGRAILQHRPQTCDCGAIGVHSRGPGR